MSTIIPSASWNGAALTGGTPPRDVNRTSFKPMIRWATMPHQLLSGQTTICAGAIHASGIQKVTFWCEGTSVDVTTRTVADGIPGLHAVTLDVPNISGNGGPAFGKIALYATAYPNGNGLTRTIGPLYLWVDPLGHYTQTNYYVDKINGNDSTGTGSFASPFSGLAKAMTTHRTNLTNHGNIIVKSSGEYELPISVSFNYSGANSWISIKKNTGLTDDVVIIGVSGALNSPRNTIRCGFDKMRFEGIKLDTAKFGQIVSENGYSISFKDCDIGNSSGGCQAVFSNGFTSTNFVGAPTGPIASGCTITVTSIGANGAITGVSVAASGVSYKIGHILTLATGLSGTVTVTGFDSSTRSVSSVVITSAGGYYSAATTYTTTPTTNGNDQHLYYEGCYIHDIGCAISGPDLMKTSRTERFAADFYNNASARFGCAAGGMLISDLRQYNNAFTVSYAGASATATLTKTGGAGVSNGVLTLSDTVNGTTIINFATGQRVEFVVNAINAATGWSANMQMASGVNNALGSQYISWSGSTLFAGAFGPLNCKNTTQQISVAVDIHADYVQNFGIDGLGSVENCVDIGCTVVHKSGVAGVDYDIVNNSQGYFLQPFASGNYAYDYGIALGKIDIPYINQVSQMQGPCDHLVFDSCSFSGLPMYLKTAPTAFRTFRPSNCYFVRCNFATLMNESSGDTGLTSGIVVDNCHFFASNLGIQTNTTSGNPVVHHPDLYPLAGSPLIGRISAPFEWPHDIDKVALNGSVADIGAYQHKYLTSSTVILIMVNKFSKFS